MQATDTNQASDARPPAAIESDLEATREHLADTIDQLLSRANPKNIVKREAAAVRAYFVDAYGKPRTDNILKVAGGVVGVAVLLVVTRKLAS